MTLRMLICPCNSSTQYFYLPYLSFLLCYIVGVDTRAPLFNIKPNPVCVWKTLRLKINISSCWIHAYVIGMQSAVVLLVWCCSVCVCTWGNRMQV